jgi:hypothetical protein
MGGVRKVKGGTGYTVRTSASARRGKAEGDLEGTWAPTEWVDTGTDPKPCPPDGLKEEFTVGY